MKLKNILFGALWTVATMMGISSCTSDYDYAPAEMPANSQAFFSNTIDLEYLLEENQNEVTIQVSRLKTDTEAAVDIVIKDTTEAALFTYPSSIVFAKGESVANIPVSFDFSTLLPDTDYALEIKLASETSAYANDSIQIIIKYAPWSEWMPYGWDGVTEESMPTYTYTQMVSGTYLQPLYYRESMLDNSQAQLMMTDWFYGVDLIIDWNKRTDELSIVGQESGYVHSTYGKVFVSDAVYYWTEVRQMPDKAAEAAKGTFDEETGKFSFDVVYYVPQGYFGWGYEYLQLAGYEQPDYSLNIKDLGTYVYGTNNLNQIMSMTFGADVYSIKYAWFEGEMTEELVAEKAEGIFSGEIESVYTQESGTKVISVEAEGTYYLVAVLYDADGARVGETAIQFSAQNPKTWSAVGTGTYTHNILYGEGIEQDGLTLYSCDQEASLYKIGKWGAYEIDFIFTLNEDNTISVAEQATGEKYNEEDIMIEDLETYTGGSMPLGKYEDGVYHFDVIYYISAGYFGYGTETFVLDSESESESRHTTPLMLENNTSWLKSQFSNSSSLKKGKRTMQHMNKSNIDVVSKEPILL